MWQFVTLKKGSFPSHFPEASCFFFSAKLEAGVDVTPATPWISRFQSLLLIPNFQSWIIPVEMSYIFKGGRFPSLMLKNLGVLLLQQTLLLLVQPLKPHFSCLGMTHPHIPFTHMYIYIYKVSCYLLDYACILHIYIYVCIYISIYSITPLPPAST